jgi:hypothetical protein
LPAILDQSLHDWRDFYMLGGAACATLIGLMFVAASIASSLFTSKHLEPMRAFVTPTVVHFAAAFFVCLIAVAPGHSARSLGGILGLGALVGLAYCGRIFGLIFRRFSAGLDWEDRAFYALIPVAGYLLLLAAATMEFDDQPNEANLLAAIGVAVTIGAGLRNAWDMTVWMTTRPPGAEPPVPPPPE